MNQNLLRIQRNRIGAFILLGLFFLTNLSAQDINKVSNYKIKVAGLKIGDLEAKYSQCEQLETYFLSSEVSLWFFGRLFVNHSINCKYLDGQLLSSKVLSQSNRGEFLSEIDWKEGHYQVDAATYKFENTNHIELTISKSIAKLYFEKPKDGDEILSETFGLIGKVKEIERDVFEIEINGNQNKYYYSGEELTKVVIQNPIKNYVIEKIQ